MPCFVQLTPAGTANRDGCPRGGFHERPIRHCPIHRFGTCVFERRFPVRRTGLTDGGRGMSTTFKSAAESYLRAKGLARGTRNEYTSTIRKRGRWGGGPIEQLRHKEGPRVPRLGPRGGRQ